MTRLSVDQLYSVCQLDDLPFTTSKSLAPLNEIVGQSRAQEAVRFAMAMPDTGYNIYAVGRNGLGKRSMILRYLSRTRKKTNTVHRNCTSIKVTILTRGRPK